MEIKKENIIAAYNKADENGKQMLRALFPTWTLKPIMGLKTAPLWNE